MTRVLITGAEGFVGTHLRTRLAQAGYHVSSGISAPDSAIPESRAFNLRDGASIDALVAGAAPFDCVVHLAAVSFLPDAERSPERVMDVNLLGTIRLLDAVRRHAPGARVLFVGSSEAYGPPQSLPVTESHPLNPANPYAISKAAADHYCACLSTAGGLDIVRARPFNHSGAGQSDAFVLSSFARQVAEMESGQRPAVLHTGNLAVARDFTHVSDVVDAYAALIESGRSGEAYNICSGRSVALRTILDRLFEMTDVKVEVRNDPDRMRKTDLPEIFGSHEKLAAATNWRPKRDVPSILSDLLAYWRARLRA